MSSDKKDFYGKEVTEAIRSACDALDAPQEQLEIEVIETGSTGIFGLIRKKAHIRARVKVGAKEVVEEIIKVETVKPKKKVARKKKEEKKPEKKKEVKKAEKKPETEPEDKPDPVEPVKDVQKKEVVAEVVKVEEVSTESLELLKKELLDIVELMGYPATVEMESKGLTVKCVLRGDFEEELTGNEGKTLDSLQYLIRKIVSRKVVERLKVTVDIGNFREKRKEELKSRAVELAALVKEDGKTQVIPALNPSERRVIHMVLQDDKEIRSRSVGDGLFKKILIFKPGKGNKTGRKRSSSRGRGGKGKKPASS